VNRHKAGFGGDKSLESGWLNGDVKPTSRKRRNVSRKKDTCWHKRRRVPSSQTDRISRVLPDGTKIDRWTFEIDDDVRQEPARYDDSVRAAEMQVQIDENKRNGSTEWPEEPSMDPMEIRALRRKNTVSAAIASIRRITGH